MFHAEHLQKYLILTGRQRDERLKGMSLWNVESNGWPSRRLGRGVNANSPETRGFRAVSGWRAQEDLNLQPSAS